MSFIVRSGLAGYERALQRAGLGPVAGADEAGRGACAGPLVAAAVILSPARSRQIAGLDDSKRLSAARREGCYEQIIAKADAWAVAAVTPAECDALGMQVANLQALRRALFRLDLQPGYVLTDGFAVDGLGVPGLAMWKGDAVVGCVAAASIVAKVTRDRLMSAAHQEHPEYGFDVHKGYCTAAHLAELAEHGPCQIHRWRFANVRDAANVWASRLSADECG